MSPRIVLGLLVASCCACVPWTSTAPATPAVRVLLDPSRDLAAATAEGDSVVLRAVAELVGRVVWDSDDTITVMVTAVRRDGAESESGVASGTVAAVGRDSTVRVEVISGRPQTVEIGITAVTLGLLLTLLYLAALTGGG